jgi:2-oxo-3-hexenedioate decarboxylase
VIDRTAVALVNAADRGLYVEPPSKSTPGFAFDDAYAVAGQVREARVAAGWRPVGYKLGFTNESAWRAVGLDSPFWSTVYDRTVRTSGRVDVSPLVEPRIEPEIVLGLGSDLPRHASVEQAGAAVAWAALGLEIVHCHYPGWRMTPADALADGGLHGLLIIGDRTPLRADGTQALAELEVKLRCFREIRENGVGANALGGPMAALAWLTRLPNAPLLTSGDIITTGTLTAAPPIRAGQHWHVSATGSIDLAATAVLT